VAVANLVVKEIQVVVQMVVEEMVVVLEVMATVVAVATLFFKIILTTKTHWLEQPSSQQCGMPHKITTMLIMGLKEAVGKPVATLMDRVLHIIIVTTVTTMDVGDVGILEKRQGILKISLALSTMRACYMSGKRKGRKYYGKNKWQMKIGTIASKTSNHDALGEKVHIDLIGPWAVNIGDHIIEFNALTCIDPITNLV
jgi:hypothetical protein